MSRWSVCLLLLVAAGCGAEEPAETANGADGDEPAGEVVVFAAASLSDAFAALADGIEATHPDLEVVLHLAGSQVLASQLVEGAPADVYAAADDTQMSRVADAGHTEADPTTLATTTLTIAVEPGNPRGIDGLTDLADPELVVVLPAAEVPAGRYAREALAEAGVELDVEVAADSLERDVRAALSKVALGEADAAIVYHADVVSAGDRVDAVPIVPEVVARYPMVALADAPNPAGARAVVAYATSAEGRAVLTEHGFSTP